MLTLGIMDITVRDTSKSGHVLTFLSLTTPRELVRNVISFYEYVISDAPTLGDDGAAIA